MPSDGIAAEYRQFARVSDGVLNVSTRGDVIYTPTEGYEKRLKRTYRYEYGGFRCFVTWNGTDYDVLDALHKTFHPELEGFSCSRHGDKTVCSLSDLIVLPRRPVINEFHDCYAAYDLYGCVITAAEDLSGFASRLAALLGGDRKATEKAVKRYFGSSVIFEQPADEIFITLKCTDEDRPEYYFPGVDKRLFPFLRAYDKTGAAGREAIRRFIESAPVYEWRVYLRWIYTMRADHAETSKAMDICPNVLKYSVRRSALSWASGKLRDHPDVIKMIY